MLACLRLPAPPGVGGAETCCYFAVTMFTPVTAQCQGRFGCDRVQTGHSKATCGIKVHIDPVGDRYRRCDPRCCEAGAAVCLHAETSSFLRQLIHQGCSAMLSLALVQKL
jgi:hypothetical protein